jgi:hypothetical protein
MTYAVEEACKLEDAIMEPHTESSNTQTQFEKFKDAVPEHAQKRAETAIGASEKKMKTLVKEHEALLNSPTLENPVPEVLVDPDPGPDDDDPPAPGNHRPPAEGKSQEEIAELVGAVEKKSDELVDCQRERKRLETRVRGYTELNHITKYAVNLSKDKKLRDTLTYLRRTDITPEQGS